MTAAAEDPAVLPRREWPAALGYAGVWLLFFSFALAELIPAALAAGPGRGAAVAGLVAVAVFVPVYLTAFLVPRPVPAWPAWACGILYSAVLAGCIAVLVGPLGASGLLYGTYLMALWIFPHPLRVGLAGAGVTLGATAWAIVALFPGTGALGPILGNLATIGAVMLVLRLAIGREERVHAMRHELELAGQRERLAHDLHDILGHSLTVINVKAQLVERLVDVDPPRARAEAAEAVALSRTALAEARAAVSALAVPELGGQLSASVAALRDAGIEVSAPLHGAVAEVPAARRALAAWFLREAATNVLRHAQARRVEIALDAHHVAVRDDGVGLPAHVASGPGPRSLSARAAAEGARLRVGPGLGSAGTCVSAAWGEDGTLDEETGTPQERRRP